MPLKSLYVLALGLFLAFLSCSPDKKSNPLSETPDRAKDSLVKYATRFAIEKRDNCTLVHIFGNKLNRDTTATYVICASLPAGGHFPERAVIIKGPCRRIAALSSIYANILYELQASDYLIAIDNIDYVVNPQIIAKHALGQLAELSKGPEPDLEKTISLHPDIVFTFGMGDPEKDINPRLLQGGIAVAISIDHLEETPLARAEWIKFYAAFIGKEKMADSLFRETEKNYKRLRGLVKHAASRPQVLSEIKYGDTWYVPGGKSFMAELLKDAGAAYIWAEDPHTGSLPLSFEQVYVKAKDADFWINLSMVKSKEELLSYEGRYKEFKAYRLGQVYNNNKVTNAKGYSTYWETGMIYPNRILSDFITLFHPELLTGIKPELYYYKPLN